ncbi:helix-turn-helix domain-containing protein [Streptomyces sp. IBSBF 2806]|uniref:helix-turn-helix domain-containing protein n=1 Tax=Streptomyces sp. IBSBF 2806 TaxID=2903529 RepID=UPI003FA6D950
MTTSRARAPDRSTHGPAAVLTRALSQLQHLSGKSRRELAHDTHVSASYVSRVLTGERCPSWKIARRLTLACGGDPAENQPLWAAARGQIPTHRQSLPAALRGLHLAARPTPHRPDRTEHPPDRTHHHQHVQRHSPARLGRRRRTRPRTQRRSPATAAPGERRMRRPGRPSAHTTDFATKVTG